MRLSALARSGGSVAVHSKLLGETILFAADNAEIPSTELVHLVGVSPDVLKTVHEAKKALDGEVV